MVAHIAKPYIRGCTTEYRAKPSSFIKTKGLKTCILYNKPDHIIEGCFKKHELLPHLKKPNISQVSTDYQPRETSTP